MALLLTLLPIYLFGNLHCIGMCGPLVLMLGAHRYRYFYFFGRTLSFALAGLFAGAFGNVLQITLHQLHISSLASFMFGGMFLWMGFSLLYRVSLLSKPPLFLQKLNMPISKLLLKDKPFSVFLFGFLTIVLPCGQTILVYSALALEGDIGFGFLNGFLFALLTSPSLFLAMHAQNIFKNLKRHYNIVLGYSALIVGILALCRGFADAGLISHWILNSEASPNYHIAIY